MRITALAGGVGGARFLRGLRAHFDRTPALSDATITVIGNTGDDINLFGLRVCPDLDTVMYTLGGGVHEEQGWGRAQETHAVQGELAAYGAQPQWFGLGDRDFGTHIARSQWLGQGLTLSEVTARLCVRWGLADQGVRLLPMTDSPVETHVIIDGEADAPARAVHFQEWWVRMQAAVPAQKFVAVGMDRAIAAPGVLDAIREADVILLPPSNPVVSIGIILGVPGVRDALRGCAAPVVGVSPLIGGAPVRGHADACLAALGLESTTQAVAGLYADFLDGWLVDDADAPVLGFGPRLEVRTRPLWMRDLDTAADIAGAALDLALELRRTRP
ncbi:MAG TPA: 2-phospho-L-lactate transferase [Dermatophilaceae bacterium]|nr:2-phospho-L-lactate transferase [Dermatophilaceae bacterium]